MKYLQSATVKVPKSQFYWFCHLNANNYSVLRPIPFSQKSLCLKLGFSTAPSSRGDTFEKKVSRSFSMRLSQQVTTETGHSVAVTSGEPGRRGKRETTHFSGTSAYKNQQPEMVYASADSPPTTGSGFLQGTGNTPDSSSFCWLLILQPSLSLLIFPTPQSQNNFLINISQNS